MIQEERCPVATEILLFITIKARIIAQPNKRIRIDFSAMTQWNLQKATSSFKGNKIGTLMIKKNKCLSQ